MIEWLNSRLGDSIFKGHFAPCVAWCASHLSVNNRWQQLVRSRLKISDLKKVPPWVSELYLCASFVVGVVFLLIVQCVPPWLAYFVAGIALYRTFEIALFAVNWIFTAKASLHSYKRSLAGFMVNIAEVVVFFAVAYIGFGFLQGRPSISTALYSSLRTTVTIGPISTIEPPASWFAGAVIIYQISVSYFMAVIVMAAVVGSLKKRDVVSK
jgi:hypothetical protein